MSPSLFPFLAYLIPSKKACFVTSISLWLPLSIFPTAYVLQQSPLNPSLYATRSTLTISPSFSTSLLEGIPWITTSFTELQILAGKSGTPSTPLGYPFSAGIAPFFSLFLLQFCLVHTL